MLYGFGPFGSGQHPGDTPGPFYAVLHGISALQIDATGHKTILFSTRVETCAPSWRDLDLIGRRCCVSASRDSLADADRARSTQQIPS